MADKRKYCSTARKPEKKPAEVRFLGDSSELKKSISRKMKAFIAMRDYTTDKEAKERLDGFIFVCESVLDLKFFKRGKIRSMPELIEAVKKEREELSNYIFELQPKVEEAHNKAEEAFRQAGSYLANQYEDSYNSYEQEHARELIDEFQAEQYELERAEAEKKSLWWLLGIIHRPIGFFEKAIKID